MDSRLRRAAASYVGDMQERNLREEYISESNRRLKEFVEFFELHGVKCASKITAQQLKEYLKQFDGMKASTQKHVWAILHCFLIYAGCPVGARYRYHANGRSRTVRWLTEEQQAKLLSLDLSPRQRLMIVAGLYGGLRRGGVRQITREDAENGLATGVLIVIEKGSKEREMPLHILFRAALENMLRVSDFKLSERLVPITDGPYSREYHIISAMVGFRIQHHDLRRTFAFNLRKVNTDMDTVKLGLGHTSLVTTEYYVRPMESKLKAAIEALPIPVQMQEEPVVQ